MTAPQTADGGPILSVSRIVEATAVRGPGLRAAVWVRGCPLRCPGCVSPEDLPFEGGTPVAVSVLAGRLNALPDTVSGVTFSGGEPMAQATALTELVDRLRAERDWSVMSYTGFTLEHLKRHGTAAQHGLLERLDLLVDGPYVRSRHAALAWRGSDNQGLHELTGRHRGRIPSGSTGLEFRFEPDGVGWVGVPPTPDFRATFERLMAAEGVVLGSGGPTGVA